MVASPSSMEKPLTGVGQKRNYQQSRYGGGVGADSKPQLPLHEAAYDAYITGVCFSTMVRYEHIKTNYLEKGIEADIDHGEVQKPASPEAAPMVPKMYVNHQPLDFGHPIVNKYHQGRDADTAS